MCREPGDFRGSRECVKGVGKDALEERHRSPALELLVFPGDGEDIQEEGTLCSQSLSCVMGLRPR